MFYDKKWNKPKVVMYCQIGGAIDMAEFAINGKYGALKNIGLPEEDCDIVFICWKTPKHTYEWLDKNNFKYVDMEYDEGKGFLWNLYKGWNYGYTIGFEHGADYICPIATDHAFHKNWLKNLVKHGKSNRIVNCKLIEPGTIPTLHTARNFGTTTDGGFNEDGFVDYCNEMETDKLVFETIPGLYHETLGKGGEYGHRLDAMPFLVPKDVWDRFGPMNKILNQYNITGDTDFFDRCKLGGVEITKSLDAISYHCGGLETRRNMQKGIYT
tara:strand:- start:33654 stop:34460 length:807 start_codon:yes stop_codon:yes gene_type:complete